MAIVEYEFHQDLKGSIRYVTDEREPEDVVSALNCEVETAYDQFRNTKRLYGAEDGHQTIALIQSFPPKERDLKTMEEFHQAGRDLANALFPGFEVVIKTHTDKGHIHNHILVNTIHVGTGSRIKDQYMRGTFFTRPRNQKAMAEPENAAFAALYKESKSEANYKAKPIHWMRTENDKIAKGMGLSIVEGQEHQRLAKLPDEVLRMERYKKDTWVMMITQAAVFARDWATSYDEYVDKMQGLGIDVRVEKKNIIYRYPGKQKRVIRGKRLGPAFDKEELQKAFAENDQKFQRHPELRIQREKAMSAIQGKNSVVRDSRGAPLEPEGSHIIFSKDYGAFTPKSRRGNDSAPTPAMNEQYGVIPGDEMRRAKGSILDYCKRNNIQLTTDAKGRTVVKGREHYVINDYTITNTRNNTHGSLIQFVASHKKMTYLQAIAHINNNPRLLLLEKQFGAQSRTINPFYIPKDQRTDMEKSTATLNRFFQSTKQYPNLGEALIRNGRAQVSRSGTVRLLTKDGGGAALEFHEYGPGVWRSQRMGRKDVPFFAANTSGKSATIFMNPHSLIEKHGPDLLGPHGKAQGILGLFGSDEEAVNRYVAENRSVSKIFLAPSRGGKFSSGELDFFNVLHRKFKPFGIEVVAGSPSLGLEREGPDLSR